VADYSATARTKTWQEDVPALADAPGGWKSYADKGGKCLIWTPADWKQTELGPGFIASPDKHAQAFVDGGDLPYPTFKQVILPMDQFKGARRWRATTPRGARGTSSWREARPAPAAPRSPSTEARKPRRRRSATRW